MDLIGQFTEDSRMDFTEFYHLVADHRSPSERQKILLSLIYSNRQIAEAKSELHSLLGQLGAESFIDFMLNYTVSAKFFNDSEIYDVLFKFVDKKNYSTERAENLVNGFYDGPFTVGQKHTLARKLIENRLNLDQSVMLMNGLAKIPLRGDRDKEAQFNLVRLAAKPHMNEAQMQGRFFPVLSAVKDEDLAKSIWAEVLGQYTVEDQYLSDFFVTGVKAKDVHLVRLVLNQKKVSSKTLDTLARVLKNFHAVAAVTKKYLPEIEEAARELLKHPKASKDARSLANEITAPV